MRYLIIAALLLSGCAHTLKYKYGDTVDLDGFYDSCVGKIDDKTNSNKYYIINVYCPPGFEFKTVALIRPDDIKGLHTRHVK